MAGKGIDFDGWFDRRHEKSPDSLGFWLEYWAACYRHLLSQGGEIVRFINYDALCQAPERGLRALAEIIECREAPKVLANTCGIRASARRDVDTTGLSSELEEEVATVRDQLIKAAPAF